tara:strand:+ start:3210 stop:3455 length:246 start_codon:yes stop_codon:yes gene_type:complete
MSLLDKVRAWLRVMQPTPKPKQIDKVEKLVDLIESMAELSHIDPQQIVDAMQKRLEVKQMKPTFDPDIDAVVEQQGGHFNV